MSDNDVTEWVSKKGYRDNAIPIWITPGSDIEASFCTPEQIEHVFKISREDSEQIIKEAINSIDSVAAEKSFNTALQSATASIPMEGRSAPSARWRELGGFGTKTVKGKELLRKIEYALKNKFAGTPEARKLGQIHMLTMPAPSCPICDCLKAKIEEAIADSAIISAPVDVV